MSAIPPGHWELDAHNDYHNWVIDLNTVPGSKNISQLKKALREAQYNLGQHLDVSEQDSFDEDEELDLDGPSPLGASSASRLPASRPVPTIKSKPKAAAPSVEVDYVINEPAVGFASSPCVYMSRSSFLHSVATARNPVSIV